MFVTTIEDRLLALATDDGRQLWTHQAANATTSMLGRPAPAYADGLVVAGFGSGELAALRAESGSVVWTDTLAAAVRRRQPGGLFRDPRAAGGRRRPGLCDRHGRPDGGGRSADRPAAVGARGRRRGQPLGRRDLAVRGLARPEDCRGQPRRWPGRLGDRAAALGEPGEAEGSDHLVRPAAGRRPADRGGHQSPGAGGQSLYRRDPRPAGAVRERPRWARSSSTARCSW